MEKPQEEILVERQELVLAAFALDSAQPVAKVIGIAVKETFFLDEIDEHQAVQHQGRVPLRIGRAGDAFNERKELLVFCFEAVVESLSDLALDLAARGIVRHSSASRGRTFKDLESPLFSNWLQRVGPAVNRGYQTCIVL